MQTKEGARRRSNLQRKMKSWDARFRRSLAAAGDTALTTLPKAMAMIEANETSLNERIERHIVFRCLEEAKAAGLRFNSALPAAHDTEKTPLDAVDDIARSRAAVGVEKDDASRTSSTCTLEVDDDDTFFHPDDANDYSPDTGPRQPPTKRLRRSPRLVAAVSKEAPVQTYASIHLEMEAQPARRAINCAATHTTRLSRRPPKRADQRDSESGKWRISIFAQIVQRKRSSGRSSKRRTNISRRCLTILSAQMGQRKRSLSSR